LCLHLRLVIALTNPAHRASAEDLWSALTATAASHERLGSVLRYAPLFGDGREEVILARLDQPGVRAHSLTAGEKDVFIAFARGKLDDTKLVATMTTCNARTLAHYTAGLMWLARGPDGRDHATKHFRDARELMNFGSTSWQLSTAFLIRMNDPAWPSLAVSKKKP
jgi:hypothetical protein